MNDINVLISDFMNDISEIADKNVALWLNGIDSLICFSKLWDNKETLCRLHNKFNHSMFLTFHKDKDKGVVLLYDMKDYVLNPNFSIIQFTDFIHDKDDREYNYKDYLHRGFRDVDNDTLLMYNKILEGDE